jgi:hypothetical protein
MRSKLPRACFSPEKNLEYANRFFSIKTMLKTLKMQKQGMPGLLVRKNPSLAKKLEGHLT